MEEGRVSYLKSSSFRISSSFCYSQIGMESPGKVEVLAFSKKVQFHHIRRKKQKVDVDAGGFVTGGGRRNQVLSFEERSSAERMEHRRVLAGK